MLLQAKDGLLGDACYANARGEGNVGDAAKDVKGQREAPVDRVCLWVEEGQIGADQADGDAGQSAETEPAVQRVEVGDGEPGMGEVGGEEAQPAGADHRRLDGKVDAFLGLVAEGAGRAVDEDAWERDFSWDFLEILKDLPLALRKIMPSVIRMG